MLRRALATIPFLLMLSTFAACAQSPPTGPIPDPATGLPLPPDALQYSQRTAQQMNDEAIKRMEEQRVLNEAPVFPPLPEAASSSGNNLYKVPLSIDRNGKPRTDRTSPPLIQVYRDARDKKEFYFELLRGEDNSVLHYTLDGSQPTVHSAIYTNRLAVAQGSKIRAVASSGSRQISKVEQAQAQFKVYLFFNLVPLWSK
jgi:hypothetical protein